MTKELLLLKIEKPDYQFKKAELINDVKNLPNGSLKFSPNINKIGDIRYHGKLGHHIVLVRKSKDNWTALLLTSNKISEGTIPVISRCVTGYITNSLIQINDASVKDMAFSGVYDNHKQLREAYKLIKSLL